MEQKKIAGLWFAKGGQYLMAQCINIYVVFYVF